MVFCDWLLLLNIMFPRFTHAAACVAISFFLTVILYSVAITHFVSPLLHSWVVPTALTIMNDAVMNIHVCFCVDGCFHFSSRFHFSRPRSWISGSQSNSVCNHLRNCQTAFQSNHTILHSYQQYMRAPISPHPWQHLLWSIFFITASQVGVEWYLVVVLICTLLMTNDVEHLFMRWLATCMSSLAI